MNVSRSSSVVGDVDGEEIVGIYSSGPKVKENDLQVCLFLKNGLCLIFVLPGD